MPHLPPLRHIALAANTTTSDLRLSGPFPFDKSGLLNPTLLDINEEYQKYEAAQAECEKEVEGRRVGVLGAVCRVNDRG